MIAPMAPQRYHAASTRRKRIMAAIPPRITIPISLNQNFAPSPSSTFRSFACSSRAWQRPFPAASSEPGDVRQAGASATVTVPSFLRSGGSGTSARQVAADVDDRRGDRRSQHQPEHPEDAAGPDCQHEHRERVQVERRAHREGLEDVLQQPVGQDHDQEHDQRGRGPFRAQRDDDCEGARDERPDVGDVGGHEGDHRDRARQRHAEYERGEARRPAR